MFLDDGSPRSVDGFGVHVVKGLFTLSNTLQIHVRQQIL